MKNANSKVKMSLFYVLPVLAIIVVIAIGILWVQPKINEIQELQTKKIEETERGQKMKSKLNALTTLESRKTDLIAQLSALTVALPNQKEVPELILQLQKIASESDVQIQGIQLTPGKLLNDTTPQTKGGPALNLSLSCKGNYEAIKTFLGKIYKAKRLITMDSLTLNTTTTVEEESGGISAVIAMNAFYQPLPSKPKDETDSLPQLTTEQVKTYEDLQNSYTSYQINTSQ